MKRAALFFITGLLVCSGLAMAETEEHPEYQKAIFAGGNFWFIVPAFEARGGVISVTSGYTGGEKENPTYQDIRLGKSGHVEAVEIIFDPVKITYTALLDTFWKSIDPTDSTGQFSDRGPQFRTVIFYLNDEQRNLAEKSKEELVKSGRFDKPIVTAIMPASEFYPAEEFHQDYYKKNPSAYFLYRALSRRDRYLRKVWQLEQPETKTMEW
ncbi:MAG: peptide-methionine (S)-S-oxide reductase MsrA [Deltaproteobacteria bacterium]